MKLISKLTLTNKQKYHRSNYALVYLDYTYLLYNRFQCFINKHSKSFTTPDGLDSHSSHCASYNFYQGQSVRLDLLLPELTDLLFNLRFYPSVLIVIKPYKNKTKITTTHLRLHFYSYLYIYLITTKINIINSHRTSFLIFLSQIIYNLR